MTDSSLEATGNPGHGIKSELVTCTDLYIITYCLEYSEEHIKSLFYGDFGIFRKNTAIQ